MKINDGPYKTSALMRQRASDSDVLVPLRFIRARARPNDFTPMCQLFSGYLSSKNNLEYKELHLNKKVKEPSFLLRLLYFFICEYPNSYLKFQ